jgi:exonuclease VII small subunit
MWKNENNKDDGAQHMNDMLTTYKGAVEEFSVSAAEFLTHIPILNKARDAYQRAMAVSTQLRHVLDKGDETLRLLMRQMEQAGSAGVAAADKKPLEVVKVDTTTANGDKADAARA